MAIPIRTHRWLWVLVTAYGAACAGEGGRTPMAPTQSVPAAVSAGVSDCYTPKFTVTLVPSGASTFDGAITGDLEGTVVFTFADGFKGTGATMANSGTAHWEITGGIIPGLGSFDTTFDNRNQLAAVAGSPGWVFENLGKHRAVAGVEKANLTYRGVYDDSIPQAVHDYQGVICK